MQISLARFLMVATTISIGNVLAQEYRLEYKPFAAIIYHFDLSGKNIRISSSSPLILQPKEPTTGTSLYYAISISPHIMPGLDESSVVPAFQLDSKGLSDFWGFRAFSFPQYMPIDARRIADWPVVLPFFPRNTYRVGDEWDWPLPAPLTFTTDLGSAVYEQVRGFFLGNAEVRQKFVRVVDMLGYRCAQIDYRIADSLKIDGRNLRFLCNGTVYFAIQEGFIVSDIMRVDHDLVNHQGEALHQTVNRKLRMIKYKPVNSEGK